MINLLTSGAAFIASLLFKKLIFNVKKVICIDNFSLGSRKNIEKWPSNNNNLELILILGKWDKFWKINWDNISNHLRKKSCFFDSRSIPDLNMVEEFELNNWIVSMECS